MQGLDVSSYLHVCYQILYTVVVPAMADQQPTVVKEKGDPLTTSHHPVPSTEQYAPHDDTVLDEDSYIIICDTNIDAYPCTTHLSTPCSVENGETMYEEVSKMCNTK